MFALNLAPMVSIARVMLSLMAQMCRERIAEGEESEIAGSAALCWPETGSGESGNEKQTQTQGSDVRGRRTIPDSPVSITRVEYDVVSVKLALQTCAQGKKKADD